MKLLTQTSIYLSALSVLVFLLLGLTFNSILKRLSNDELDAILRQEKVEVLANPELLLIADRAMIPFFSRLLTREVDSLILTEDLFYDSVMVAADPGTSSTIRCLKFYDTVQGQPVEFILYKSKLPSEIMVRQVIRTIVILMILFLIGVFLTNRLIFIRVWGDFFHTIRALREYVPDRRELQLPRSQVHEFETLNREIEKMTLRVSNMYDNLQRFTSHTTHEFQTPLAVIRSKSELLLQSPGMTEEQLQLVGSIAENVRQLSQLNRSLGLLFKIDNRHYPEKGTADPAEILMRQLEILEEWIERKELTVETHLDPGVTMPVDPALAKILIQNLAKNAVVHNLQKGSWQARLSEGHLQIRNSGLEPERPESQYFSEFVKGAESRGLGLGLALVKKVCEVSGLQIQYHYSAGFHQFDLRW